PHPPAPPSFPTRRSSDLSAGMFVQSEKFVEEHQGRIGDISIFGQESNPTTWKLAHMNLAIRGIEAHLGQSWADSFLNDQHKDLKDRKSTRLNSSHQIISY